MSDPTANDATETTLDFAEMQKLAAEILAVEPDQVQLDVSFAKDLAADSLDIVELIMAIEDRYQVSLPEEELEHMKKVGDLWTFLLAHPATADR
ncbi:MAG: acyl carrier protein [Candidatus Dormiibacterota bacterium]